MKKRKVNIVNVPQIRNHDEIQINIKQKLDDDKKINPTKIFDKYDNKNKIKKQKPKK